MRELGEGRFVSVTNAAGLMGFATAKAPLLRAERVRSLRALLLPSSRFITGEILDLNDSLHFH
jgi:hypothetical protein